MRKTIFIVMFVLMMFPFVFAEQQSLGSYKQNECVDIVQTCGNCTYVNITSLKYPNSTAVLTNVEMTKDDTFYNYTFCNTSTIGRYIVNQKANPDGDTTTIAYSFDINTTGQLKEPSAGLYALIFVIVVLYFFLASRSFSAKLHKYLPMACFMMAFIHILAGVFISYLEYNSFAGISGIIITLFSLNGMFVLLVTYLYIIFVVEDHIEKAEDEANR